MWEDKLKGSFKYTMAIVSALIFLFLVIYVFNYWVVPFFGGLGKTYNLREYDVNTGEVTFDIGKIQEYTVEGGYIKLNDKDGINIFYKAREGTIIRIEEVK